MPVPRDDPYSGYNFEISIPGVSNDSKHVKASFSEVSGLEVTIDPIDYRVGSEENRVRKIQGLKKFTNITLKRGISGHLEFWKWIVEPMTKKVTPRDGQIKLLDEDRKVVLTWNFEKGWPCKWSGPGLNAKNNEIAMETLEICHQGLSIDHDGQQKG